MSIASLIFQTYSSPASSAPLFPFPSLFISPNLSCRKLLSHGLVLHHQLTVPLWSSCNQCESQINISKQWVTSPSWFWFFCCLSRSVSVLHRIRKPEHDILQIPADHWGLTTAVSGLYTCMSAHLISLTFMVNTKVKLMVRMCLRQTPKCPQNNHKSTPFLRDSIREYICFLFFGSSVLSVIGHDRCQLMFFFHIRIHYFHLKSVPLFEINGSCIL